MSKDKKKPSRIKARLPRGLKDYGPAELSATRGMVEKIRKVYELYGFEAVETPAIEYTETLGKFLPDTDRPNEGVFSFQDDDEQWMSLRYDLTAPLARYVAENFETLPKPYRSYRVGWVYRNEKPGPGRYRQFMQFDADTVGTASPAADAEMCMMAADTMEKLGFERGQYVIKVNNRKVLDGVMQSIGLGGNDKADVRLTVLRALDKYDRLGTDGVRALLGKGRKDESGDFTRGANLADKQISQLFKYFNLRQIFQEATGNPEQDEISSDQYDVFVPDDEHGSIHLIGSNSRLLNHLESEFGSTDIAQQGLKELSKIIEFSTECGFRGDRIRVDSSVVRGLEYYTGPVYEVELLVETKDEKGNPVRFGSVGGGGRYDGLVARFRGEPVPATGFSIGVSRLLAALQTLGKVGAESAFGPVVVTVFDKDSVNDYQRMVKELRDAGIRAELYLGNPKNLGNQLKYADRRNAPCVIIQGGDEKAKGEVQVKDLVEGAKAAEAIASNKEWRETRPAQFSIQEADLVKAVREVLARHGKH